MLTKICGAWLAALTAAVLIMPVNRAEAVSGACTGSVRTAIARWAGTVGERSGAVYCETAKDGNVIGDAAAERVVLVAGETEPETGDQRAFVVVLGKRKSVWTILTFLVYGGEGTQSHRIVSIRPGVVNISQRGSIESVNVPQP
jgi:hypothetical protein